MTGQSVQSDRSAWTCVWVVDSGSWSAISHNTTF